VGPVFLPTVLCLTPSRKRESLASSTVSGTVIVAPAGLSRMICPPTPIAVFPNGGGSGSGDDDSDVEEDPDCESSPSELCGISSSTSQNSPWFDQCSV